MLKDLFSIKNFKLLLSIATNPDSLNAARAFLAHVKEVLKQFKFSIECQKVGEFVHIIIHISHYDKNVLESVKKMKNKIQELEKKHGQLFVGNKLRIILSIKELDREFTLKEFK